MNDVQLQKIQKDITKSITAISESYVNSKDEKLADAISLASHASHALDVFRRMQFKPEINKDYLALCAEHKPIDESLFGSLTDEAKACSETAKITNKLNKKRVQPYKKAPFLGNRGSQYRRGTWGRQQQTYYRNNYNNYNNNNYSNNKQRGGYKKDNNNRK